MNEKFMLKFSMKIPYSGIKFLQFHRNGPAKKIIIFLTSPNWKFIFSTKFLRQNVSCRKFTTSELDVETLAEIYNDLSTTGVAEKFYKFQTTSIKLYSFDSRQEGKFWIELQNWLRIPLYSNFLGERRGRRELNISENPWEIQRYP